MVNQRRFENSRLKFWHDAGRWTVLFLWTLSHRRYARIYHFTCIALTAEYNQWLRQIEKRISNNFLSKIFAYKHVGIFSINFRETKFVFRGNAQTFANIRNAKKRAVLSRRRSICVTGQYVRVESHAKSREFSAPDDDVSFGIRRPANFRFRLAEINIITELVYLCLSLSLSIYSTFLLRDSYTTDIYCDISC